MLDLIRKANQDVDYEGKFWLTSNRKELRGEFKKEESGKNKATPKIEMQVAKFPEAVDKMAFWSALLHSLFMIRFSRSFVVDRKSMLEMVLFFGHQCNGTMTIVHALTSIALGEVKTSGKDSWHRKLAKACCFVGGKDFKEDAKDVGASHQGPRFSPSNNSLYSEKQIAGMVTRMEHLFKTASEEMKGILKSRRKGPFKAKLFAHHNLAVELCKRKSKEEGKWFPGVGSLRASHVIQFASLIGLLPLEFYVYLPMHCSGGPKTFMEEYMNWEETKLSHEGNNDGERLISWTESIMKDMNKCFGNEWTCNMLENSACLIARNIPRDDLHFLLPWIDKDGNVTKQSFRHQIEFRVDGDKRKKWKLVGFDGLKKHVFIDQCEDSKDPAIIGNDDTTKDGSSFNLELVAMVYKS